jgi:hypothetical protein
MLCHLTATYTFDLHCTSTTHKENKTMTDVYNHTSQAATLVGASMFTTLFSVIPYWQFYVLLFRKAWHAFNETIFIDTFHNEFN